MGMFSEANAEANVKQLETILTRAIDEGGKAKEFVKQHLYQWYLNECSEAFIEPNHEIFAAFED
jgi:hypothetical protein